MGIKKAQAPSILSAGLGTAPIHLWLETALWCAVPMMYRFAHKSLVRGTNSAERLSNKKIRVQRTRCKDTTFLWIRIRKSSFSAIISFK